MNPKQIIEIKINEYIERYSIKHKVTKEEAKQHKMVKITEDFYRGEYHAQNK